MSFWQGFEKRSYLEDTPEVRKEETPEPKEEEQSLEVPSKEGGRVPPGDQTYRGPEY